MKFPLALLGAALFAGAFVTGDVLDVAAGPGMEGDVQSLSASTGGEQLFAIDAGPAYGGFRYIVAGSSSGIFPGTLQNGLRVPLNYDAYTETVLTGMGRPAYVKFSGYLDSLGRAQPSLKLPVTSDTDLIGTVYYHAAILIDPKTRELAAATNPVELLLLP